LGNRGTPLKFKILSTNEKGDVIENPLTITKFKVQDRFSKMDPDAYLERLNSNKKNFNST